MKTKNNNNKTMTKKTSEKPMRSSKKQTKVPVVAKGGTKKTTGAPRNTAAAKKPSAKKSVPASTKPSGAKRKAATKKNTTKKATARTPHPGQNKTVAKQSSGDSRAERLASQKGNLPVSVNYDVENTPEVLVEWMETVKKKGTVKIEDISTILEDKTMQDVSIADFYELIEENEIKVIDDSDYDDKDIVPEEISEERPKRRTSSKRKPTSTVQSDDIVRQYLNDISKTPLLTSSQEIKLAKKKAAYVKWKKEGADPEKFTEEIRMSKDAFDYMWKANLRLVVSIARSYSQHGLNILDLAQEGNLGLMRAIEKFDYKMGFKLSTYATWWIRQALRRALADQLRTVRIPVHKTEELNKYRRARSKLAVKLGRDPKMEEIAEVLKLPVDEVEQLRIYDLDTVSLNKTLDSEDGSTELQDMIADDHTDRPEHITESSIQEDVLNRALAKLSPQQSNIIKMRHGLGREQARTLDEVASKMGTTRERIRIIERESLQILSQNSELSDLVESIFN